MDIVKSYLLELKSLRDPLVPVKVEFRPSCMPYCGLKHYFLETSKVEQEFNDFFTEVGNAVHRSLQRRMLSNPKVRGNFKCLRCSKVYFGVKPKRCLCKSDAFDYLELAVEHRCANSVVLVGHVDMLLEIKPKRYLLVDYKTISLAGLKYLKAPKYNHVVQTKVYGSLLRSVLGLNVVGILIHYVARDHYKKFKVLPVPFSAEEVKPVLRTLEEWAVSYELALAALANPKLVRHLIRTKPCSSYEYYKKFYSSYPGCPLGESGVCFSERKLLRTLF